MHSSQKTSTQRTKLVQLSALGMALLAMVGCANPLLTAVQKGNVAHVTQALQKAPKLDAALDAQGNTLLHIAVTAEKAAIVDLLLSKGAKPEAKNRQGWTPLHQAVAAGSSNLATALIRAGASGATLTADGWNLWHLHGTGGKGLEIIRQVQAQGIVLDANLPDKSGVTPLMVAASCNQTNAVQELLTQQAKLAAKDKTGWTPLHFACAANAKAAEELLLKAGADPKSLNEKGQTPDKVRGQRDAVANAANTWLIMQMYTAGSPLYMGLGNVYGVPAPVPTFRSDRAIKEAWQPVAPGEVRDALRSLPIAKWKYLGESAQHIGPSAQDFRQAFKLGDADTSIAVVDGIGVALAAIQDLTRELDNRDARLRQLERELAELKAQLGNSKK